MENIPKRAASLRLLYDGGFAPSDPDLYLMSNLGIETAEGIRNALYYGTIGSAEFVDVSTSTDHVVYDLYRSSAENGVASVVFTHDEADCIRTVTMIGNTKSVPTFGTIPLAGSSVTVDDALSTTSTNPVQNKVVKAALDAKADASALAAKQDTLTAGQNVTISGNTISADVDSAEIAADVTNWLDANVNPVGSAVVVDSSLTVSGAAADSKAVGDKLVKFNSARNGFVPASGVKSDKKYYLAGNGKFEKIPFDPVACQNLMTILQSCVYDKDVSINLSNLADALGINSGGGDDMTFQFGQSIPKGNTSRTLTGLEQFQMTEIRLVVALHSDFQQGAFCLVTVPAAGSPYLGISSTGDFYYSNQGSYPDGFSATPANLVDFVGSEPKEVKIQYLNPSGWESRKYISSLKFFFNNYNPSCGFTLFRMTGYDGATKLFNLESTGTNGELYDTMTGTKYTFDNTSGMEIVEVEEE